MTVKLYAERLEIVHAGKVVAQHKRLAETGASTLDPLHYLPTLLRKPATLDHAHVFTAWELPPSFPQLRATFEQIHGTTTGARHYIRVLQLLLRHPVQRVERACEACRQRPHLTAEMIAEKMLTLASGDGAAGGEAQAAMPPGIPVVKVPPPDLRRFDALLSQSPLTEPLAQGESYHGLLPIPFPGTGDAA